MTNFQTWWHSEGSAMRPLENEDLEEFAKRVTEIAWSNGGFCAIEVRKAFDRATELAEQPAPVQREPLTDEQIDKAAMKLAECMDYPWAQMPEQGKRSMRSHAKAVIEASGITKGNT